MFEEFHDLSKLFLGFVNTCYISKRGFPAFFHVQPGPALSKGKGSVASALHLIKKEEPQPNEEQHGKSLWQYRIPPRRRRFRFG
jgi:hypothetical protein